MSRCVPCAPQSEKAVTRSLAQQLARSLASLDQRAALAILAGAGLEAEYGETFRKHEVCLQLRNVNLSLRNVSF